MKYEYYIWHTESNSIYFIWNPYSYFPKVSQLFNSCLSDNHWSLGIGNSTLSKIIVSCFFIAYLLHNLNNCCVIISV